MPGTELISHDEASRNAFSAVLHRQSNKNKGGLSSMVSKNSAAYAAASQDYFQYWDNKGAADETEATIQDRTDNYASLASQYYNLATDFYEYGWSQSFHFCRFAYGEGFRQAIARHEHYIAHQAGIKSGMKVLDVGCGVGGPAREIVKFTGAHVTGLNLNAYQVQRATNYAAQEGLSDLLDFVQGDFMNIPFPDNSFDAVYAIEATCHAPNLKDVYSEIHRVLKPGGTFAVYEWLMTDDYDNDDLDHRRLRLDIEQGDGIPHMYGVAEGLAAIRDAGFELEHHEDLADMSKASGVNGIISSAPWYWPIGSSVRYAQSVGDLLTVLRMNRWGRTVMHSLFGAMETVWLIPQGTKKTAESLGRAADGLVEGGRRGLFTPMYLMVGKKSAEAKE